MHEWHCKLYSKTNFNVILNVRALQVLRIADDFDKRISAGENLRPLCGYNIIVKDNIDVAKYVTAAGTPALEGKPDMKLNYWSFVFSLTPASWEDGNSS